MKVVHWDLLGQLFGNRRVAGACLAPSAIFEAEAGFGEESWVATNPENCLAVRLGGGTVRYVGPVRAAGRQSSSACNFALTLQGAETSYLASAAVRFAHVYLPDDLLARACDGIERRSLVGRLRDDMIFAPHRGLEAAITTYVARCFARDAASALEMEARALLIVDELAQAHAPERARAVGGLAPWALRRCCEHLESHLAEEVELGELAALAKLSPFHFARMFKASTGLPPHAYQRRLRCERAQALLRETDLPVTEIALAVGYATPQAFARMFLAETGTTPSAWRRGATG